MIKHELANILFPHNFPEMIDAYGVPEGIDFSTLQEGSKGWTMRRAVDGPLGFSKYSIRSVFEILWRYQIPFSIESIQHNMIYDQDGEHYVDTIGELRAYERGKIINPWKNVRREALSNFMRGKELGTTSRRRNLDPKLFREEGYTEAQISRVEEIIEELRAKEYV